MMLLRSLQAHHDISLRCGIWTLSGILVSRQPNALKIYGFTA